MKASLTREEAEEFLFYEARLLDELRLREWLDLLAPDVIYWVPINADDIDPVSHLSIIYDDYGDVENRVWRILESGMNHTQDPPSKFVRFVTNVSVEHVDDLEAFVHCNLLLTEFRPGIARDSARSPSWRAARCRYRLRRIDEDWKIAERKIMLLDNAGPLPAMSYVI